MSTPRRRTLADWIVEHPRPFAQLRRMILLIGLIALGVIGTISGTEASLVERDPSGCEYRVSELNTPLLAERAAVNEPFAIEWRMINTGSCSAWSGIRLARRSDQVLSEAPAYPVEIVGQEEVIGPDQRLHTIVRATIVLTAPAKSGVYETAWQLQTATGRFFGPRFVRRVQVYAGPPPVEYFTNQPPPPLTVLIEWALSFGYYLLPALLAVVFVLWRGVDLMDKLFRLKPPANSWNHILAMMFDVRTPGLSVKHGKFEHDPANTAAEIIGGPALLTVFENTAALLEHGGGFSRIVGPGTFLLLPHERVRNVIDLQTQHRQVTEKTLTKDGLPIEAKVDLGFRITQRHLPEDAPIDTTPPLSWTARFRRWLGLRVSPAVLEASRPHRFSREAVRRAVYETAVFSPDRPPDWAFSFANVRSGDISDQLAEMRLDELYAPGDPTQNLRRDIAAKGLETARQAGAGIGVDVVDMSMGVIELPKEHSDPVTEQLLSNWRLEWQSRATVLDAEGDAKRLQLQEEARAEAQANMIQALTEGFRIATGDSNSKTISNEVIALRFIDTLEALLAKPPEKSDEKHPDKPAKPAPSPDVSALFRTLFGQS